MFYLKKKSRNKGFTIVEILVVIAIIGLLSATVWINYNIVDKEVVFERSVNELAQEIRKALEMALSSTIVEGLPSGFQGGYGVFFPEGENYYVLFSDLENTRTFNDGDQLRQIFFDSQNITIHSVGFEGCSGVGLPNIVFLPPDPTVFVGGAIDGDDKKTRCNEMVVSVAHPEISRTITVKVNRAGLIEVEG